MPQDNRQPILVIGRRGQVASALVAVAQRQDEPLIAIGRPAADLTDPASLEHVIGCIAPSAVINAGAYTAVDGAETDRDTAFAINADGPAALAAICRKRETPFIHISTDCVFDGRATYPYTEDDPPNPLCVYGQSKLAGEQVVAATCGPAFIVRVGWVFSHHAGSFVRTMLTLAETRRAVQVVSDQVGYPTHAEDIAAAMLKMLHAAAQPGFNDYGLHHIAAADPTDRATQAEHVFAASRRLSGPVAEVERVTSAAFGAAAARPLNARLDGRRARERFGLTFGDWKSQTVGTVARLLGRAGA